MTKIKFKEGNNWVDIGLEYYPIGAIYQSTSNTSPSSLFGGTWTEITDRFLLAAGTTYAAASTGGAATVTLTSAQSGVPAHSHGTTITQPAFNSPKLTHTITQPAFSVTKGGVTNGITGGSHQHTWIGWWTVTNSGGGTVRHCLAAGTDDTSVSTSKSSAATHTHNLPDHTHTVTRTTNVAISDHSATACSRTTDVAVTVNNNTASNASAAHENMPPYLAVYTWKRVA